ncbi:PDZ domain-containing protein [Planosporangium flavigriseum]|uniref:Peptidase S1 n=1 Tax=Planosporangium flavigriseum TaxID=373681 RepID=A0A8J3LLH7_9ACTN|nr:trypsin-like peptidase domain-containing protein [Planosporangium flavigriseum]NJC66710.1 PDZ domain-containing protein [Planosporangium flavigriseum]GIG74862.1 peptidase S1 [Planosporangium flavigriseum]
MSEHDSMWASGASGDRPAGQAPQEQEGRQESTLVGQPEPTGSAGSPAAEAPTTAFPAASYQGGSYPGYQPHSGYPQTAAWQYQPPAAGGPGQPGTPYPGAPTWQPAAPAPGAGNRAVRGVILAVAALVLALVSGLTGGFIGRYFGAGPTVTKTLTAAPTVDRTSVAAVAAKVQPVVVDISTPTGEGSGVVISADGNIVTNNHVVEGVGQTPLDVTFSNGKTAKATVVGTDPGGDLAVIKATGVSGLPFATLGDSDAMQVGDTVLAIGSPLGLQGSVTAGIISALHRTIDEGANSRNGRGNSIGDALQTDAAINPGNSGGALVNLAGEVIGINTAIATSGQGAGNIGVGFAIPSNQVKSTAQQLLSGKPVAHPFIGVQIQSGESGALIADVTAGGPADKAGLRKGDLVTKIGDRSIPDAKALSSAVKSAKVGDRLPFTIVRNGSEQQIQVTIGGN